MRSNIERGVCVQARIERAGRRFRFKTILSIATILGLETMLMVQWSQVDEALADHVPEPPDEIVHTAISSTSVQSKRGLDDAINLDSAVFDLISESRGVSGSVSNKDSFGGRIAVNQQHWGRSGPERIVVIESQR